MTVEVVEDMDAVRLKGAPLAVVVEEAGVPCAGRL